MRLALALCACGAVALQPARTQQHRRCDPLASTASRPPLQLARTLALLKPDATRAGHERAIVRRTLVHACLWILLARLQLDLSTHGRWG